MGIEAAIIGSAVAGAAGSAIAGSEAAGATEDAAKLQAQTQRDTLAQQERLSAPYRGLGESAIPAYMQLLGIGPKGQRLSPQSVMGQLQQTPGYQFALNQGLDATKRQAAAMGLGLSGNTLQALDQYSQGLAGQTYQTQLENLLSPIKIGEASAANQAANVGQVGTNLANIYGAQGQNQANIATGMVGGITNAIGGGMNNYITMNTLRGLQGGGAVTGVGSPAGFSDFNSYALGGY